jgi:hypothetical protein
MRNTAIKHRKAAERLRTKRRLMLESSVENRKLRRKSRKEKRQNQGV